MEWHVEFRDKLRDMGASIVGFSEVKTKLPLSLSKLEYAVTVGVRLSDFILDEISDRPTYTYFHHYKTINTLIDQITLRGMLYLQEKGYNSVAVPASQTVNDADESYCGIFPHKTAAVLAGLGWIGKSDLFISNQYGPRLRLGTILTDAILPIEKSNLQGKCGECRLCVDSCPALALTGNSWHEGCNRSTIVDVKACSDFMNSKFKHIGRGSVCGICVKVCHKERTVSN
jgi:epoxyqueuosine reductase